MADLNKNLENLQDRFYKIRDELKTLLRDYDEMFHEVNASYMEERMASEREFRDTRKIDSSIEDFYRLLLIMRRNKDVIGSLVRGTNNMRPVDRFKFVEEEREQTRIKKPKKVASAPSASYVEENFITDDVAEVQALLNENKTEDIQCQEK